MTETLHRPAAGRRTTPSARLIAMLVLIPSILVAGMLAILYLVVEPLWPIVTNYYFSQQAATFASETVPLYIHIVAGTTALCVGAVNITRAYLGRRRWHRRLGLIYACAVAIAAPAAFVIAFHAYTGTAPFGRLISTSGFTTLAVAWIGTLIVAVVAATRGATAVHRRWITLNFSLTFAAVTLRAGVGILFIGGQSLFEAGYPYLAWVAWVPNLVAAAILVVVLDRRRRRRAVEDAAPGQ